jgi:hypothetical protein
MSLFNREYLDGVLLSNDFLGFGVSAAVISFRPWLF